MPTERRWHWAPGVEVARRYRRAWLRDDLVAGVALTALLIPAGMGYAVAAGLPPETGLYATVVPLLVYAAVGPSRILVLGPDSSLAPIIAASVLPLADGDPTRAVALAGVLALMVGGLHLVGGLLHLGVVTDLLSKPIRVGYLNGIAVVVIVSQLPELLGLEGEPASVVGTLRHVVRGIADGDVDLLALAVGGATVAVIVSTRVLGLRVAGVLLAVVGATVATAAWGWEDRLAVVGALPGGVPAPALSGVRWGDLGALTGPAVGLALIAFADTGVLSRAYAARRGDSVDSDQELVAVGAANVASGCLGGFPVSASSSRTPVAEQVGAHTQLVGVVGAALILGFVVLAPGATAHLPAAALAGVVVVAASSLVDVPAVVWLARTHRTDAALSVAAFLGVTLIGVLEGIGIAIALSLVAFVDQAWRPYRAELGLLPGRRGYHDLARHPEGRRIPGVVIARFDAPLFFANAGIFGRFVLSLVDDADGDIGTVILAAEPITAIDTTAVDQLVRLDDLLASRGIELVVAEMKGPVKDQIRAYGLGDRFAPDRFQPTVGAAVDRVTGHLRGDIEG